jgi:polar amino acid transport system substrate-binding protein
MLYFGIAATLLAGVCSGAHAAAMQFVMQSFPPFVISRDGVPEGLFPDVIQATCAALRIECSQRVYPWRRALRMVELGEADGIAAVARLPEREVMLHMMEPLVQSEYAVFTRADNPLAYLVPADLNGYTLGVYGPSATSMAAYELANSPGAAISVELEIDNATVLRKLGAQRYRGPAAGVLNADVGNYLMRQEGFIGLRVAGEVRKIEYSIGLSRKKCSRQQVAAFNAALHELIKNGTVRALLERYGLKAPPLPALAQGRGPPARTVDVANSYP